MYMLIYQAEYGRFVKFKRWLSSLNVLFFWENKRDISLITPFGRTFCYQDRQGTKRRRSSWFYPGCTEFIKHRLTIGQLSLFRLFTLTLFQPGGGGVSLAIATKINRSTPNFLTFNFYYRDIFWPKIKLITCQGVTWSLFCRKHFVSPHIFHCIFTEFSCSTFSVSDIYIQC